MACYQNKVTYMFEITNMKKILNFSAIQINEKLDMLNRHKDELSLEWDKRWEHLQLGNGAFHFHLFSFFPFNLLCHFT